MQGKSDKSKPIHKDQGSASSAKLDHKGMSHRSKQGQECGKPSEFTQMVGSVDRSKYKWSKGVPSDGPFSAPHSGKSMKAESGDKKALTSMKSQPPRNSK